MDDQALVRRFSAGEIHAFDELAGRYHAKLHGLAYRMLGNHEDAQDAVQEILVRLLRSLPTYVEKARFSTWLYRLASNTIVDFRRRHGRAADTLTLDQQEPVASDENDPDAACSRSARAGLIATAMQALPEPQRMLLALRDQEGLSNQEVADILGIEVGTLKARLHRARSSLRKILESGLQVSDGALTERLQMTADGQIM